MKTRSFSENVLNLCSDYSDFLSVFQSAEQDKLDNIPEGFVNSSLQDKLSDGIDSIQQVIDNISDITDLISDIPDILNIKMRRAAKLHSLLPEASDAAIPSQNHERKTERIQIVVTPSLNTALRNASVLRNVSMNEIVNSVLASALSKLPNPLFA